MTRALAALALSLALSVGAVPWWGPLDSPAHAEEWGNIEPGVSTMDQVRERFGAPSKETKAKVDNYDTSQWVYDDARAPSGFQRMTVEYGLLTPQGYKPSVVRVLRLEPKEKIFGKNTVLQAFGYPDGMRVENEQNSYFYQSGLIVTFDKEDEWAVLLNFMMPQPDVPPKR